MAMTTNKQHLYQVASGAIENPSIEIEVDGETQKFEGRDAKLFAFGMLAGLKAAKEEFSLDPLYLAKEA